VNKNSARLLYDENDALTRAEELETGLTVSPVEECIDLPDGAALLLSPVGEPLTHPTTREEVANLFELLWQLHAHDLMHGDPRVPNVIRNVEEKLLWIDLVELRRSSRILRCVDAEILTRSILLFRSDAVLETELNESIDLYGENPTRENLKHLITMVCQELLGSSY